MRAWPLPFRVAKRKFGQLKTGGAQPVAEQPADRINAGFVGSAAVNIDQCSQIV